MSVQFSQLPETSVAKARLQTQLVQRDSRVCRSVIVMVLGFWLNTMIEGDFGTVYVGVGVLRT